MAKEVRMRWAEDLENLQVVGTDKLTGKTVSLSWEDVSEENRPRLACFALKTILATRTSAENADVKVAAMMEVAELLGSPRWDRERQGGSPTVSLLVEAVAAVKGISIPAAQKALAGYDKEAKKAIEGNPKVAAKMAKLRKLREESQEVDLGDLA